MISVFVVYPACTPAFYEVLPFGSFPGGNISVIYLFMVDLFVYPSFPLSFPITTVPPGRLVLFWALRSDCPRNGALCMVVGGVCHRDPVVGFLSVVYSAWTPAFYKSAIYCLLFMDAFLAGNIFV